MNVAATDSNSDDFDFQNLPPNMKWREFKLPRSFLQVYVLEAMDMEVRSIESLQAAIDKDLGILDMVKMISYFSHHA